MATVTFDKATRIYPGGEKPAVDGLDIEVGDGEFLVLVGPSGCGKSTSLRMLAGLEDVNAGAIRIGERDVTHLPPKDRDIAMVFQNYALYPHMTVADNMAFSLKMAKVGKEERMKRVAEAAKLLDLEQYLDRKPKALSGGQRQRVAMGRALVREPRVFLMDEPLSNLDAKLRVQMRIEIKRLHQTLKTTSIYVTHDQVEAMTLADRLIVMNAGRAEQIGSPMDVYAKPATTFVAGFIGSPAMNMLPGRLGDDGTVEVAGVRFPVATPVAGAAGRPVTVGVRPEHIVRADQGTRTFDLRVDVVETLGADTLVHGRIGGAGNELIVRLPGILTTGAGDVIPLAVAPQNLHLFDAETGARL
ncbi:MAG TPA: sn-glycerol-3-phosphate ABC transporter ATP-binding protein UgpC [Alphaproteobacteria bacterium]